MKIALIVVTFLSVVASAQQPQLRPTPPELQPAPAPAAAQPDALGLIPEAPEPAAKPKGHALTEPDREPRTDRTTAAQNEMTERVRLRELITKVRREPKVAAEWDRSETARTDHEKREALKAYYTLLYDRIAKLDPRLKARAQEVQKRSINRLAQTRVDPSVPIDPRAD